MLDDITQPVHALAWSPDSTQLAVGSGDDGVVQLWDVASRRMVNILQEQPVPEDVRSTVGAIAWDPSGTFLAVDRTNYRGVDIWDVDKQEIHITLDTRSYSTAVEWNLDGTQLVSQGIQKVQIWNTVTWTQEAVVAEGVSNYRMDWNPTGGRLVTTGTDGRIFLWDTNTQQLLTVFQEHMDTMLTTSWNADGTQIAVGNGYDYIQIWDAETGQLNRVLDIPLDGPIWVLDWSAPSGYLAGNASYDGFVIVWDVTTGDVVCELDIGSDVRAIAWSPDGAQLAVAGSKGMIALWDAATWRVVDEFEVTLTYCESDHLEPGWHSACPGWK